VCEFNIVLVICLISDLVFTKYFLFFLLLLLLLLLLFIYFVVIVIVVVVSMPKASHINKVA
jgi:hypothetical protein